MILIAYNFLVHCTYIIYQHVHYLLTQYSYLAHGKLKQKIYCRYIPFKLGTHYSNMKLPAIVNFKLFECDTSS